MKVGEARTVCTQYRDARALLHDAVRLLHANGVQQLTIAELSGLTRQGIRRIILTAAKETASS